MGPEDQSKLPQCSRAQPEKAEAYHRTSPAGALAMWEESCLNPPRSAHCRRWEQLWRVPGIAQRKAQAGMGVDKLRAMHGIGALPGLMAQDEEIRHLERPARAETGPSAATHGNPMPGPMLSAAM